MSNEDKDQKPVPTDIPTGNPGTDNKDAPTTKDFDPVPMELNNNKNEK